MSDKDIESDESLLARISSGNRQAFAILVNRHTDRFYGLAWRSLTIKDDADDIVQDAFLKLWQTPGIFDPQRGVKFTSWFYRVIVNLCMDRNRKKRSAGGDEILEALPSATPSAVQTIMDAEQSALIERALAQLPERQRMALNLCFYEGLSNQQAADIMNVNIKALESLIMRAKKGLKDNGLLRPLMKEEVYHARTGS